VSADDLQVPFDELAERIVIGCAVATPVGARLQLGRVTAGDFYRPAHGRLLEACRQIEHLNDPDERVLAVAEITGVPIAYVQQLVDDRPVMHGRLPGPANRVLDAARRRKLMAAAAELFNQLGGGARLDDVRPLVRSLAASA
jgi:replicative DNA helicase